MYPTPRQTVTCFDVKDQLLYITYHINIIIIIIIITIIIIIIFISNFINSSKRHFFNSFNVLARKLSLNHTPFTSLSFLSLSVFFLSWTVAPKRTKSCKTQAGYCLSVYFIICPFFCSIWPLRLQINPIRLQINPLSPQINPIRPHISPIRSQIRFETFLCPQIEAQSVLFRASLSLLASGRIN